MPVLSGIHEDVHERISHLAGRFQRSRVIPIGEDGPAPSEGDVDPAREANGKPTNAIRERAPLLCFHNQMNVIVLDRELDDAKRRV